MYDTSLKISTDYRNLLIDLIKNVAGKRDRFKLYRKISVSLLSCCVRNCPGVSYLPHFIQ